MYKFLKKSAVVLSVGCLVSLCALFTASAHNISADSVKIECDTAVYTGEEICPEVTVNSLEEKKDYFVTYAGNINAGRATVMIDDVNDECATVYKYFDILPCDIANADIKLSYTTATYSGKKKKPTVTVTYNGKTLEKGKDYSVSYKNNTKVGKATVTVKGIGNFQGEIDKKFYIKPNKIKGVTVNKAAAKTVKLSWKKASGATAYQIYCYKNGKWQRIGTSELNSFTVRKLESDTSYKFKIRAIAKLNGKTLYGTYSQSITVRTSLSGSDKVYITSNGSKYHRKSCSYLKNSKIKVTYSYAKANDYTECSKCF